MRKSSPSGPSPATGNKVKRIALVYSGAKSGAAARLCKRDRRRA